MKKLNRRNFLESSGAALAAAISFSAADSASAGTPPPPAFSGTASGIRAIAADEGKKPLRLGLIIGIGNDPDAALAKVHELGLPTSQISVGEFEVDLVSRLRESLEKYQIEATSVVVGGPGK